MECSAHASAFNFTLIEMYKERLRGIGLCPQFNTSEYFSSYNNFRFLVSV